MEVQTKKERTAELRLKEKETLRIKRCRNCCTADNVVWFHPISVLGLDPSELEAQSVPVRAELITKKYRDLARVIHPDRNTHADAQEAFSTLSDAYTMLLDHALQRRLITAEMRARKWVENSVNTNKKKAKSDALIASMVEERLEVEVLKIFLDFRKAKETATREQPKQEEAAIILMPAMSVPNNCNNDDDGSVANGERDEKDNRLTGVDSPAETMAAQPISNETKDNSLPSTCPCETFNGLKRLDGVESQSSGETDFRESLDGFCDGENLELAEGAEDNSCTALSTQLNANDTEIVAYYTGDLDSLFQPTVVNSLSLKGAEGHAKNKMAHKKDRHEAGVSARARQRQAAEKRMAKKGFAFTGKVRFAQSVDEQTDAL